jgi:uncharacterized coiled-coil protein SlyX
VDQANKKEDFSFLAGSSEAEVKAFFKEDNQTTIEDLSRQITETQEMLEELGKMVSKIQERVEQFVSAIGFLCLLWLLYSIWHWFKK